MFVSLPRWLTLHSFVCVHHLKIYKHIISAYYALSDFHVHVLTSPSSSRMEIQLLVYCDLET